MTHKIAANSLKNIKDEEYVTKHESGFTRDSRGIVPIQLVCPELERRVGLIFAEGLIKYKDSNVTEADTTTARFGGPLDNLIKHMLNHLNKWRQGDRTEDHLAKIAWSIQQIMHQETNCEHYNIFLKAENRISSLPIDEGKTK